MKSLVSQSYCNIYIYIYINSNLHGKGCPNWLKHWAYLPVGIMYTKTRLLLQIIIGIILTLSHIQHICSRRFWELTRILLETPIKWKYFYWIAYNRNCSFWAISYFVSMFSKSRLLQRRQKASIWRKRLTTSHKLILWWFIKGFHGFVNIILL